MTDKTERNFQSALVRELKDRFPGCLVTKMESYIQGFPDLVIFYKDKWAFLECKRSATAPRQPNQEYYINLGRSMSFASFIYPENKEEVLDELQRTFEPER